MRALTAEQQQQADITALTTAVARLAGILGVKVDLTVDTPTKAPAKAAPAKRQTAAQKKAAAEKKAASEAYIAARHERQAANDEIVAFLDLKGIKAVGFEYRAGRSKAQYEKYDSTVWALAKKGVRNVATLKKAQAADKAALDAELAARKAAAK
jgi:hypothetical protein